LLTEIASYKDIEAFTQEVSERLTFIAHRQGKKLETLFKDKIKIYLPKYDQAIFDAKYQGII
jgi:hypothetical protein